MRTAYTHFILSFLTVRALLCRTALSALAAAWKPGENLEIVVAGSPGGGTNQLARLVQSTVSQNKLLDVNTVAPNKGGGNGAEAFLDLRLAKGNAHKLVIGTNNVYLLPLMARLGYQWTDLTPVTAAAEDDFILWTYQATPWADVAAFLTDLKKDAVGMRFGGSQPKDVDQTLSLLLSKQVGGKPTYISLKSGSEASIQLAGRRIAADLNNPARSFNQWYGDQVWPLCVFSHERMTYTAKVATEQSWADIPTCHEQGLGIDQYRFPRAVFLPGGVSDEQRAFYVELMRKVSQTDEFRDYVERSALVPTFLAGEDPVGYIEKDHQRVISPLQEVGWLRQ